MVFSLLFAGLRESRATSISLIRDTEIENTIRLLATPIFEVAELTPSRIQIYLVNDRSINAFVSGGENLFINTGLLMASDNLTQVTGVIAHEVGHIAGGHLARTRNALKRQQPLSILALVLGGAVIAAGETGTGSAIIATGPEAMKRSFLAYSRTQESSADQAAILFLEKTRQSGRGFVQFMQKIADQEFLSPDQQDPYVRTHPISRDRITRIIALVEQSPYKDAEPSQELKTRYRRMLGKLRGFLNPITTTLGMYKETDSSIEARYARAIAHHRRSDFDQAMVIMDSLIAEYPDDPYFHELKGQLLRERGHIQEALVYYQKAVELAPSSHLMRLTIGEMQLNMEDEALLEGAIEHIRYAISVESNIPFFWRLLAIAYGRKGNEGMRALAMGEEAFLQGKPEKATFHARKAVELLASDSPGWLQADDLLRAIDNVKTP